MKLPPSSLLIANALLALSVAVLSFDAAALKKAPPKPGWHVCGTQGVGELNAVGETLLKACEDIGMPDLISGKGGGSFMYCKDGQHTCCESDAAGSITECSSVGGTPNSVLIPKRPTKGAIAADGKAPPTQAQTPANTTQSPAGSAQPATPPTVKK
ncbi:MAG: hypothetical protein EAZ43_07065 [Betaproteobacteria bacterium]|nr:MAG: hypothetical protein EAZ43_07065 [Betaproteobacteria bacterium]